MKKILILLLALFLTLSFGTVCFGAEAEAAEESADKGVLTLAYGWVVEHAAELLSALTLVGSLILSFSYKKGLLPTLSGALNKISGSVSSAGEYVSTAHAALDSLAEKFGATEELCRHLADEIAELSARLEESEEEKGERERMKIILSSQVDMLYEIFITSGLPQYAKEAVGERVREMKAALGEVTGND